MMIYLRSEKRYLNLSKQHHPDLLLNKGVPEEVINESKNKMRAINSAWDQVQKLKNKFMIKIIKIIFLSFFLSYTFLSSAFTSEIYHKQKLEKFF